MNFNTKPLRITILALLANPVYADKQAHTFNIPPQPLGQALQTLAEQSGSQMLYAEHSTAGKTSPPLKGTFSTDKAAQLLLADSGLAANVADNGTVTVKPSQANKTSINTLAQMNVVDKYVYDATDPYNKNYAVPNSTTATKTDTPIMETPVSIQVIPRKVMDDQQTISVGDALKNVSGVQPGAYTFYDNFMIRGFEAGQTTYRNGLRQYTVTNLETANLNQVEVLKGPASILFGRVEPGGLVNLVTKRALETPYYSVQQQFGSYSLFRTTVDATGPILKDNSLLYRMNIAYKDNKTFRDFSRQEHIFIAPSLTWRPTDKFETNLDIEYQNDKWVEDGSDNGIPALGNRPAPIPISRYLGDGHFNKENPNTQEKVLLDFDWSYKFNDDWKLKNRFQYTDIQYHQSILWSDGLNDDNVTINRGLWHTPIHRIGYTTNLDLTGKFDTGFAHHDVLVGFDLNRHNTKAGGGFSDYDPAVTSIDIYNPVYGLDLSSIIDTKNYYQNIQDNWYGLYFQDQITLWDKLHILGGGRQDWAEDGSGISSISHEDILMTNTRNSFFSPRVGILYQPWRWLSVYGNYVESFGNSNGRSSTGKPFSPETAKQYEAGIKTEFFDGRLNSTVAFYNLTKNNILTQDPDNPLFSIAIGKARSRGVEFDITGQVTENISLIGSYAYTDTKILQDNSGNEGNKLAAVPLNSGSLWGKYEFTTGAMRGLDFGTGVYVRSQRQGDNANTFQLPGYARWDASVGYGFNYGKSKITTQLNVYNLLDKTYYDHSSNRGNIRAGDPLTLLGSVRIEF